MKGMILVSEELIQRNLTESPEKMGEWDYYNIGSTTLKALKNAKIIPDYDYRNLERRKPDALITSKSGVIAVIEYKQPSQLRTEKQVVSAISQELDIAKVLSAKVYIVTDGSRTLWINPATGRKILHEDGSEVTLNFDRNSKNSIVLINRILSSISPDNDRLSEFSPVDPLPLAEKIWQDLWAVSGATPENCLYTFVEIFIFKYLSDLNILPGMFSFYDLIKRYSVNTESEVLEFYASGIRTKIKEFFPGNPKDKTTIINGTIFVSKDDKAVAGYASVFRKILKRFSDFGSLENIDYDFKSRLFETFLKESISRKNWGQYFTPLKVVRSIVNMADIAPGMKICDPACGVGKFLLEPILRRLHSFYIVDGEELKPQIHLHGFDKGFDREEQKTIILAKANMLIYMSDIIKEHKGMEQKFAALFNETFLLQTNSILGTLAHPVRNEYDLILTNPPYVMSGSSNLKEEIDKNQELKEYFTVNAMGIEGLFMEWIINALKPGGKAFVIVPDGIMNRSNDKKLRRFILEQCNIDAVISLPLNTFFTTNKKTYILALTKKIPVHINGIDSLTKQDSPVFTYLCSEIGETRDTYRFSIEQDDLKTASELFNMFKGAKNVFRTDDRRCKVVSIDSFYDGSHWCVDRWWTQEELIALGVKDEAKTLSVEGFRGLLDDIVSTLAEFSEPLREAEKKNLTTGLKTKEFPLSEIFNMEKGSSKYTRTYGIEHSGIYPVYSASGLKPLAYIDTYDYDGRYITWSTNGFAGTIMIIDGKFSVNGDRGILMPIANRTDINFDYIKFTLEPVFRGLVKGRKDIDGKNEFTKLYPSMLENVNITLPVKSDGSPDLFAQQKIAEAYLLIEEIKQYAAEKKAEVENCTVMLDDGNEDRMTKDFALTSLFSMKRGSSKYTKKYCSEHAGKYPLYSASIYKPLGYIDTYDYDGRYITWSTDGFAGHIMIIEGKFSVNSARGILIPLDDRTDIDFDYVKFILEPVLRKTAKGRRDIDGRDEYTHLPPAMLEYVMIPFPVKADSAIDIDAQKEIAGRYKAVQACKDGIISQLNILLNQKVIP